MFKTILSTLGLATAATAVPAEGGRTGAPELPTDYETLLTMAGNHVAAQQSAHSGAWRMDEARRFDVDPAAGRISWFFDDGTEASAPVQLVGTWNPQDETFLWGWDHPSAPPGTAQAVKNYADANGIAGLQTSQIACDFDACWRIAGTASLIGDLQGLYRFEESPGGAWVYVGFADVTLKKS
ncbi:DUF6882 domain-containing protein [Pontivivens ytuae]|uniref:Uncharacterized protein n=1 Tax=Pontivivens ytuae TaxID=2789856 RepID=A0A7S9LQC4_9RHOB|nr:DUF6882 domain-containing protein [Pontivivens ytuae]QPH53171.1 hypothetical protein I0K15_15380 [Pontivivens ytuae]